MKNSSQLLKIGCTLTLGLWLVGCAPQLQDEEIPTGFVNPNVPPPTSSEVPNEAQGQETSSADSTASSKTGVLQKYDHLDPQRVVPTKALQEAVLFFDKNKTRIKNQNYLTLFDSRQHSGQKRLFVIDMKTGAVSQLWVAHGSGSDPDADGLATRFSNQEGSKMTSLGFYLTGGLYEGKHGTSMYLHGLEATNSNAYSRSVVMHGADYVSKSFLNQYGRMGASWGCPAIEMRLIKTLLPALRNGSVLYIFRN